MLNTIATYIPPWLWILLVVHLGSLGAVAYMILLERKVASWAQDRVGPNRTGLGFGIIPKLKDFHFWGLGQPLADGLKFFVKEDYRPKNVDKILFTLAPMLMIAVVIVSIAVIPWGGVLQSTIEVPIDRSPDVATSMASAAANLPWWMPTSWVQNVVLKERAADVVYRMPFQIADLNIGVLFVIAFLSLAVYGIVVGGWASNNKFSFLGGLRATANMISYEIPLGLAILCIVATFGTLSLGELVDKQLHYWFGVIPAWNIFTHPVAFLLFLICIHAEANRAPFDIAEAEQELVGGYHTEYSSMRFALFFLAEYAGMITTSAVCVALFLGGWHLPWIEWLWRGTQVDPVAHPSIYSNVFICILNALVFFGKTMGIIFIFMWTRWSLPRFRFDQIMQLAWRSLIPISLALLATTTLVIYCFRGVARVNMQVTDTMAVALLASNVAITVVTLFVSTIIPPAPATNRRVKVENSRFNPSPVPTASLKSV